ncbi:MAG: M3 family oligoendopeptidase [Rhodobacteraceae bacterium]|nr:M3 family oligoendopeptidase [Paracoccaceae bacterium]
MTTHDPETNGARSGIAHSPDDAGIAQHGLDELPEWDLSDLYPSVDSPELAADRAWLVKECHGFNSDYAGRLASLFSSDFLTCIHRLERICLVEGRIMSFAGLRNAQDLTDAARAKFLTDMTTEVTDAMSQLVFFELEINKLEKGTLCGLLEENEELGRYREYFEQIVAMKPYLLSDELERYLHDQSVVGVSAWGRLFDETVGALEFDVGEETLSLEVTLHRLSDPDRGVREQGARALARELRNHVSLFSRITNTLAKEKEVRDRWRKLPAPQSRRHLANRIEPEIVGALRDSVVAAYPRLSHRYYKLKAKWLGLDYLEIWDRNAPLPESDSDEISWDEARRIVLDAFSGFSPGLADVAKPFFENGWIDVAPRSGKAPGAFAHPTVVNVHPYILLNYQGRKRDVMVLAHELGHGVHQCLSSAQGQLLCDPPLTLSETASVFGEMLTFRRLLDSARSPTERKILLASKVEDMINTVVRQIAFYDFESRVHEHRREGEIVPDRINEIWMDVQRESLGPHFRFMEGYETFWTYIPHFIHAPFYVYAYAFGDCLVNSLFAVYLDKGDDFVSLYIDMLSAGGSKHHVDLLKPFGLDASDPSFWDKGLVMLSGLVDQLEEIDRQ